jgi:hypothetical protein
MPKSSPILISTVWAAVLVFSICKAPARDLVSGMVSIRYIASGSMD